MSSSACTSTEWNTGSPVFMPSACAMSAFAFSFAQGQHLRAVAMAARRDLVGDVAHLEQGRDRLRLGDEGADALDADQPPVQRQLAQGPVDGHAADAEVAHQLRFRRDAVTRLPLAGIDAVGDHALDARIAGQKFDIQRIRVRSCLDRLMPDMICNHKGSSPFNTAKKPYADEGPPRAACLARRRLAVRCPHRHRHRWHDQVGVARRGPARR